MTEIKRSHAIFYCCITFVTVFIGSAYIFSPQLLQFNTNTEQANMQEKQTQQFIPKIATIQNITTTTRPIIGGTWIEDQNNLIMCKLTSGNSSVVYGVNRCDNGQLIHIKSMVSVGNDKVVMGYKARLWEQSQ